MSVEDLIHRADELASKSKAEATKKAYQKDLETFIEWATAHELPYLPSTPAVIKAYLADCEQRKLTISTITRALTAISQLHKSSGFISPTSDDSVRKTLDGLRRELGTAQNRAKPILFEQLVRVIEKLGPVINEIRDAAILAIGWSCALRRSEIVALNREDIESVESGLIVNIRRSKTDQEGSGRKIGIPFGTDKFCPVQIIRRWITIAQITEGPLFFCLYRNAKYYAFPHNRRHRRLSDRSVSLIIKRCLELADYDSLGYSGHSLRAGFCTSAAQAGIAEHAIMSHTGHRSEKVMRGYIREGNLFVKNPLTALFSSFRAVPVAAYPPQSSFPALPAATPEESSPALLPNPFDSEEGLRE
jgi:site-specific recombinase XerD